MPAARPDDPLDRALGIALDPREAVATDEARAIRAALLRVPLPSAALPGWQSLCASEYAEAVHALRTAIRLADDALAAVPSAAR